jgi:ribulose-phosphate 3-epimerase
MPQVAVTILATTPADYAERIDRIKPFVKRLHLDVSDGRFSPTQTINLEQMYDIDNVPTDIHVMFENPLLELENVISLAPKLVICHFESANVEQMFTELKCVGIKIGLALKKGTTVAEIKHLIPNLDHVLIFTGHLGFNGGEFDAECLDKIAQVRAIKNDIEIGIDGGLDQNSARQAIDAGADVLYTGSFVHNAKDPEAAYMMLEAIANGEVA